VILENYQRSELDNNYKESVLMNQSKRYVMKELKCNIILFIKNIVGRKNYIILIGKLCTKFLIHLNFNYKLDVTVL